VNPDSDQFDEYRTLGDETEKKPEMVREKPDEDEYMMVPGRKLTMSSHEYYSQGGYQYGKRKKK
jgi:hypothetical protein